MQYENMWQLSYIMCACVCVRVYLRMCAFPVCVFNYCLLVFYSQSHISEVKIRYEPRRTFRSSSKCVQRDMVLDLFHMLQQLWNDICDGGLTRVDSVPGFTLSRQIRHSYVDLNMLNNACTISKHFFKIV